MQDYITKDSLLALGIKLPDEGADALIIHLNDTVEERIGTEITESLRDDELQELITLQDNASDEEIASWIAAHVPDYEAIVQDNIDIVVGELAENSGDINQAA